VECFCYSNVSNPDSVTARIRELADHWLDISSLSDEQVGEAIRKDNIDILVDLSGHTAGNRLKVFAQKPAPIQVTWVGYPGTTGLPGMDYRITDHRADPEGTSDKYHTEKLVRMEPCFLCYQPPTDAPEIGPLPAIKNGYITFGSFNNLSKLTKETILSWSILLRGIPDARLLIKAQARGSEAGYNDLSSAFLANGIERSRIEFIGYIPETQDHLDLYNKVDIALDTSPYNGTTTTCEALWMGVPVVTLSGSRHASRVGASLLHAAGLSEFVAETTEQYISIATRLAGNIDRLEGLRNSLRQTIRASSLTNQHELTGELESAYMEMMQVREK
jgi:predicted O-linked N-acetylglucosamine transferase (SPINDLY family)